MKQFLDEDFLLESDVASDLYHRFAESMPIIDYHCHLSPQLMAADHRFRSITEIWLDGDHYKWRAMRADGVAERCCTGDATDWEKFEAWSRTVPQTVRNPLYHWTHMELRKPFGVRDLLSPATARSVVRPLQRAASRGRLHGDGPPPRLPRRRRVHDRRSDRLARRAPRPCRASRSRDPRLPHLAPGPGARHRQPGGIQLRTSPAWRKHRASPSAGASGPSWTRSRRGTAPFTNSGAARRTTASRRCSPSRGRMPR